jgi:hypothetical protein
LSALDIPELSERLQLNNDLIVAEEVGSIGGGEDALLVQDWKCHLDLIWDVTSLQFILEGVAIHRLEKPVPQLAVHLHRNPDEGIGLRVREGSRAFNHPTT